MNKTVELVKYWGDFEEQYPQGSIEDFCRHHLIHQREKHNDDAIVGGFTPTNIDGLLLKLIGRLAKLSTLYANRALNGTGLEQIDEFAMLVAIRQMQHPKKTDVIYLNLHELSSGTDMLNRLIKKGYITETINPEDKRSKILEITKNGEHILNISRERVSKMAQMITSDMPVDDKELSIHLLKHAEIKFSKRWLHDKNKSFDEIYNEFILSKSSPTVK